jgi:drug/metabolite transporter (DMT)-like permease
MQTPTQPRRRLLPMALLILLGLSWGLHFPLLKAATHSGLPYSSITMAITCGISLALFAICLARGRLPVFRRRYIPFYLVCATLGYLVPYFLALFAAARVDAAILTLIGSTSPVITLCIAAGAGVERVTAQRVLGIALGLISVALLVLPEARLAGAPVVLGMAVAFCVPLNYSTYHVYVSKRWPPGFDSFQVAGGEALTALGLMLPVFFLTDGASVFHHGWTAGHWAIVAMIGVTTLNCYLYFEIVRLAGPVFVSQANFIAIVAGVLWAIALLGERPSQWIWVSLALLVGSLALLAIGGRKAVQQRT